MPKQIGSAQKIIASMKQPFSMDAEKKRLPDVIDGFFWEMLEICYPFTLLSSEKMFNLYQATQYITLRNIAGSFVECGVFLGGAVMLIAGTLSKLGDKDRHIYLYDTFSGFTGDVTEHDINHKGKKVGHQKLQNFLELTRNNLSMIDYPENLYHFLEGDVKDTLAQNLPQQIALLRLDTDTYASTLFELQRLYPNLVKHGVLIIDDYGYSKGARKAVDEYFSEPETSLFFQRPNFSLRTAIKI